MKLKELGTVYYSERGNMAFVTLFSNTNETLCMGTIDYAITRWAESEIDQIYPVDNRLYIYLK